MWEIFKFSRKSSQAEEIPNVTPALITQNLSDQEVIDRTWQTEQADLQRPFQGTNVTRIPRPRPDSNDEPQPPKGA